MEWTENLIDNVYIKVGNNVYTRAMAVVEAEVKFSYMLGEHHLPFLLADHCTKLFQSMFLDSAIAKSFKCSRTKATAILKVIALDILQQIRHVLQECKFF